MKKVALHIQGRGVITLEELWYYVHVNVTKQHCQRYPKNSKYPLFIFK